MVHKNQEILQNAIECRSRAYQQTLPPLNRRQHITQIPTANLYDDTMQSDLDNSMEILELKFNDQESEIMESDIQNEIQITGVASLNQSKSLLSLEEKQTLEEKLVKIRANPNMTNDEKIRIFYGLTCKYCIPNMEFDTIAQFEKHCDREHSLGITSFVCCKTKIQRDVLLDHLEYHLGAPNVRILRSNVSKTHVENDDTHVEEMNMDDEVPNQSSVNNDKPEENNGGEVENTFPCDQCDKIYNFKSSLKRHLKVVHGIGRHFCNECEKEFDDPIKLKKHKHMFHDIESGPFVCELCPGESFEIRQSLYNHRRRHARDTIKHTTPNPAALSNNHNNNRSSPNATVTETENETIDEASPIVLNESSSSINYPKKPFKCTICRSSFHHPRNLRIHMSLKHKQGKPVKNLNRYSSGENSSKYDSMLKCKLCGFGTIYRNNLKRHIRVMHQDQAQTVEDIESLVEGPSSSSHDPIIQDDTEILTNGEQNSEIQNDEVNEIQPEISINGIKKEEDSTAKDDSILYQCLSDALLP